MVDSKLFYYFHVQEKEKKKEKKSKKKEKTEDPPADTSESTTEKEKEPKRAQRATSNVFALFNQAQIQEFKEVGLNNMTAWFVLL